MWLSIAIRHISPLHFHPSKSIKHKDPFPAASCGQTLPFSRVVRSLYGLSAWITSYSDIICYMLRRRQLLSAFTTVLVAFCIYLNSEIGGFTAVPDRTEWYRLSYRNLSDQSKDDVNCHSGLKIESIDLHLIEVDMCHEILQNFAVFTTRWLLVCLWWQSVLTLSGWQIDALAGMRNRTEAYQRN